MMSTENSGSVIKVLHIEDSINDSEIILFEIEARGLRVDYKRVEKKEEFIESLKNEKFDIILADYNLPNYDGISALKASVDICPVTPFIFVSGTLDEEVAIEMLKNGASDYIFKNNLKRLPSAIERALNDAKARLLKSISDAEIRKLSVAVNQSPVSIIITNVEGDIEYVNPKFTELTGYSMEELIGRNPRILKSGETNDKEYAILWETISSGKVWKGEFHNIKKNGELYWESAIISPIIIDNKIMNYVAVKEDITEKKQMINDLISAKENAEELNRLKSSFLANMSHELRTPLNGILGFSELLKESLKDGDEMKMADVIHRSSMRLHNTLNQILDISTLEANSAKVMREEILLNKLMEDSILLFEAEAKKKNLKIILEHNGKNLRIFSDRNILVNTINNLIDNAIKYTDEGTITLRFFKEKIKGKENTIIEVQDTGIGIDKKSQEFIFDEFRQVSEGLGRSFEGTGLGLSICKKYMQLLNGKIIVNSELNEGSTFRIELPDSNLIQANENHNPELIKNEEQIIHNFPGFKKYDAKVLYVENDEDNMQLIQAVFEKYFELHTAQDAENCLNMAEVNDYDLILMDINLGSGMNGKEATRILRKNPKYKSIPIIAVTAFAMKGDKEEFLEYGCSHYVSKPFNIIEIKNLIFGLLEEKQLIK